MSFFPNILNPKSAALTNKKNPTYNKTNPIISTYGRGNSMLGIPNNPVNKPVTQSQSSFYSNPANFMQMNQQKTSGGINPPNNSATGTAGGNPNAGLIAQLNAQIKMKQDELTKAQADKAAQATKVTQTQGTDNPTQDTETPYAAAIRKLTEAGQANTAIANKAEGIANTAGTQITNIGKRVAANTGGYLSTGIGPVGEGNANILRNVGSEQQQAIAQGAEAQLAGTGQALTAQGQLQSALGTAAGYQTPMEQFGVLSSLTTGKPIGGGTPQQAAFMGGQVGASLGLGGDYQKAQGYINQGTTQINALNDLVSSSGVNASNIPAMNNLLKTWSTLGHSDPRYQKLQSILSAINNSYSQVLGTAVDVQQLASTQNKGIMDIIRDLDIRARAAAEALKQTGMGYGTQQPNQGGGGGNVYFNPDGSMSF